MTYPKPGQYSGYPYLNNNTPNFQAQNQGNPFPTRPYIQNPPPSILNNGQPQNPLENKYPNNNNYNQFLPPNQFNTQYSYEITHLQNEITNWQKHAGQLGVKIEEQESEIKELKSEITHLQNLNTNWQKHAGQLSVKIEEQESEIKGLKSEIIKLKSQNDSLKKEISSQKIKNNKNEYQIAQLNGFIMFKDQKISDLNEENENLKKEKEKNDKKAASDMTIESMKPEIAKLSKKMLEQEEQNKQLRSFLTALKEKTSSISFFNSDEYELESVIGEGTTSSVNIVHKVEKEKYAQKELKEYTFDSFKRFFSECEILFLLRHPCIVRVYGFNNGDKLKAPSMILSLQPTSLEKAIKEKAIDNHHKNRITIEIVLGMRYIHKKNIMHRDLKPSNILLSKKMHVRISDFGLAKVDDPEVSQSKGIVTMGFMAPELFANLDDDDDDDEKEKKVKKVILYTNKIDVYSFGITLYYIITEKYPLFKLGNIVNGIIPKLKGPLIGWVRDLITRCISLNPDDRPSFNEIFEILKSHNYDLFNENPNAKNKSSQMMKNEIENRILKIEAFEFQHQVE